MSDRKETQIGDEIRDALNDALKHGDFSGLNDAISHTISFAVNEVQNHVAEAMSDVQGKAGEKAGDALRSAQEYVNRTIDQAVRYADKKSNAHKTHQTFHTDRQSETYRGEPDAQTFRDTQTTREAGRAYAEGANHTTEGISHAAVFGRAPIRVSAIVSIVFGSLLLAGFGIPAFVSAALGLGLGMFGVFQSLGLFFFLPVAAGGGALLSGGVRSLQRRNRFRNYVRSIGTKTICAVKTLSRAAGRSEAFVRKDLEKMIRDGYFLQGHLDDEKSCLMITDETYELYLQSKERTMEARKAQQEQQQTGQAWQNKRTQPGSTQNASSENGGGQTSSGQTGGYAGTADGTKTQGMDKDNADTAQKQKEIMETGRRYMETIRQVNDELPDPVISEKLDKLEKVVGLIYVRLQKSPDQLASMKRFTDYYLPTTIKLVNAYREFDKSEIKTERMEASKHEIEQTLDTILFAFEQMLDSLYEEDTIDISADIQVLQTLLAQEGYVADGLHAQTKKTGQDSGLTGMEDIFEGVSGVRKL